MTDGTHSENDPLGRGLDPRVSTHYEGGVELDRLAGAGRLEFLRTREIIARYLPPAPAVVLDVGGAMGAYALPLAAEGYEVHLIDPVPLHVEEARRRSASAPAPLARIDLGDARRVDRAEGSADAVLLLGPLYHLTDRADRIASLREASRVLRPGGVVIAAAISRFASTIDGLRRGFLDDPEFEEIVKRDLREGQHRNPRDTPGWFTTAFFHLPEELVEELAEARLTDVHVVAVEGPGWIPDDLEERLDDPKLTEKLLSAIRRVEGAPALLGASDHLLAVGRRPGP